MALKEADEQHGTTFAHESPADRNSPGTILCVRAVLYVCVLARCTNSIISGRC